MSSCPLPFVYVCTHSSITDHVASFLVSNMLPGNYTTSYSTSVNIQFLSSRLNTSVVIWLLSLYKLYVFS